MSKVLRRPLFRGGPVDPRGTGITSGLDTPKRGLVDGPGGYAGRIRGPQDIIGAPINYVPQMNIGTGRRPVMVNAPLYDFPDEQPNEMYIEMPDGTFQLNPYFKPITEPIRYASTNTTEGTIPERRAEATDTGLAIEMPTAEQKTEKSPEGILTQIDDTEISKDDLEAIFAEPLKKARRRDIGDILGGAAEGFLTGGLREGLIGATKAAKGPGRTEQIENAIASLKAQGKLLEGKEKRAFDYEIKKLEKMKELGLGKTSQATNFTRALEITKNPDLYPPETVAAAKRQLGTYGSLTEGVQAVKKDLGTVAYGDFLNLVEMTEPEFSSANIIPADKVDQFLSQGLDDGVYVVEGEKRIIEIKNGKKVRDRSY